MKQKKTAEEAIKTGEFIALDKEILDRAGIGVQVILPAADYKKLDIDGLMGQKGGAKVERLAEAVDAYNEARRALLGEDGLLNVWNDDAGDREIPDCYAIQKLLDGEKK